MNKNITAQARASTDLLKAPDGDTAAYRRALDAVSREVPCAQMLLVSTFPRGATQVVQPAHCPDGLLRHYNKGLYLHDGQTWQAIFGDKPVTGNECVASGSLEAGAYYRQLMQPMGWGHVAAARVLGPVFKGYPGAVHLYRRDGDAPFSADELNTLGDAAQELGRAVENAREARARNSCGPTDPWDRLRQGDCRQFIFDRRGRQVALYGKSTPMDDRLKQAIGQLVSSRIGQVDGEIASIDRVELPDDHGEVWAFHTVLYREFPALGNGPFFFMCLQPPACEWNAVRQVDLQADPEVTRMIPAVKFMFQEYQRGPTLNEIAAKSHLSPFHFHRRFTELLGLTPKHFMLACQLQQAKKLLVERKVPLAEIASICGFAHQSHFTSRFKQAVGLTPTRWRRFAMEMREAGEVAPALGCTVGE